MWLPHSRRVRHNYSLKALSDNIGVIDVSSVNVDEINAFTRHVQQLLFHNKTAEASSWYSCETAQMFDTTSTYFESDRRKVNVHSLASGHNNNFRQSTSKYYV